MRHHMPEHPSLEDAFLFVNLDDGAGDEKGGVKGRYAQVQSLAPNPFFILELYIWHHIPFMRKK